MPVKVYSKAAQAEVEVTPAEAQEGLHNGDFSPVGTYRVSVGKRLGRVKPENVTDALNQGAQIIDDAAAEKIKIRREESTAAAQALAVVEAGASSLTLGGTRWLEAQAGVSPERMAARREAAGPLATTAEVAGAVLPAAFTGGASLAPRVGVRAGLAARAGAAVVRATPAGLASRAAAKLTGALATQGGSRIVPVAAGNFVEAGLGMAGSEIDESVLGGRDLSAERLAVAGLLGGALGVGGGMALSGIADVAGGVARAPVRAMQTVIGRGNAASGGLASRGVASAVVDTAGPASADGTNWAMRQWEKNANAAGNDPAVTARVARQGSSREGRDEIIRLERDRPKIEREAAELFTVDVPKVHADMEEARRLSNGASKAEYWERLGPKDSASQLAAVDAVTALRTKHGSDLRRLGTANIDAIQEFGGGTPYNAAILTRHKNALARFHRELNDEVSVAQLDRDTPGFLLESGEVLSMPRGAPTRVPHTSSAMAADRYKRELGGIIEDSGGWGKTSGRVDPDVVLANAEMRARFFEVQELLENRGYWGGAADAQAAINGSYQMRVRADDAYREATAGTGLGSFVNPDGSVNGMKAIKLIRAHGRVGGDVAVARLMDSFRAKLAHFETVAKYVEIDEAGAAALARLKASVAAMDARFKKQAVNAGKLDDLLSIKQTERIGSPSAMTFASTLGGILGFGVGGPVGAVVGAGLVAARQPHTTLHTYAAIMNKTEGVRRKIAGVVDEAFAARPGGKSKGQDALRRYGRPAKPDPKAEQGRFATGAFVASTSKGESDTRRMSLIDTITQYTTDSSALADRLSIPLHEVERVAPSLAGATREVAARGVAFLQSKVPKTYVNGSTRLVDPMGAASFDRYVEAVIDPAAALSRIPDGRFTAEAAEALRVVYPEMFAEIQASVQDVLASGRKVPYDVRVRIGRLFDVTTDPSLAPATAMSIQMAIGADADEPDPAATGAAKPSQGKNRPLAPNTNTVTAADRTADWKNT